MKGPDVPGLLYVHTPVRIRQEGVWTLRVHLWLEGSCSPADHLFLVLKIPTSSPMSGGGEAEVTPNDQGTGNRGSESESQRQTEQEKDASLTPEFAT